MIRLPQDLAPPELLSLDDLPAVVGELLHTSRSLRRQGAWSEAERHALDALEASREPGAQVSRAAALVHLSDVHLSLGRPADALGEARRAHRLFASQPSRHQRHNQAVAAYAIGLIHQSLGSRSDALRWYQKADDLLEAVKLDWSAVNATSRIKRCKRAQGWIRALCLPLTHERTRPAGSSNADIWIPVVLPGEESSFTLAQLEVEQYIVAATLQLGGRSFRIQLLQDRPHPSLRADAQHHALGLSADAEYYALKVPDRALGLLGATEGDYALIVRRAHTPEPGPGVLETLSGPEFGRFKRDDSGQVNFVRSDATVIGGDQIGDDLRPASIAALLKPGPSPPPQDPA
ncbi:MAG: tetratricopeptide repeat protein [Chloroflexota bacterium]